MSRRPGYSLVELLVVMTVATVVLGAAGVLLHTVLRTDQAVRDEQQAHAGISRLAEQFRADVHAAVAVEPPAAEAGAAAQPVEYRLRLPAGQTVLYRFETGKASRLEQAGQEVKRRETFTLPGDNMARIELRDNPPPTVASLVLSSTGEAPGRPPGVTARIDAVVAKDHRFAKPTER
jgi:prepilin-type N-terminal cleavage/methylation domain-containing protein